MNAIASKCSQEKHHPEWTNVRPPRPSPNSTHTYLPMYIGRPSVVGLAYDQDSVHVQLYNKVTITWTTHRPLGLSYRDLTMAEFCDEQARERGEVVQSS